MIESYLSPWIIGNAYNNICFRKTLNNDRFFRIGMYHHSNIDTWYYLRNMDFSGDITRFEFTTLESAQSSYDLFLSQHYILLSQDEYDKIILLV